MLKIVFICFLAALYYILDRSATDDQKKKDPIY